MISNKELLLLTHLRNDSRKSLAKIARNEDIPVSTVFSMIHELESKAIKSNTSLIDFSRLGYNITAFGFLKADDSAKKKLKDFLMKHPNINNLSKINNGYDFFVEAIFDNMANYTKFDDFLEKLNLKEKKMMFSIEEIKKEDFLTSEEHFGLFKG